MQKTCRQTFGTRRYFRPIKLLMLELKITIQSEILNHGEVLDMHLSYQNLFVCLSLISLNGCVSRAFHEKAMAREAASSSVSCVPGNQFEINTSKKMPGLNDSVGEEE